MTISRLSTQQDIIDQYLENIGYDHAGSVASCRLFIQACRALKVMHPGNWSQSGTSMTFSPELWADEEAKAEGWLQLNLSASEGGGNVKHLAFDGSFR